MQRQVSASNAGRRAALRELLSRLRDETYTKVAGFRRDQREEAQPPPADEMDAARSAADVATRASLIEQAEYRLQLIDSALDRVDRGGYGLCAECGTEIPLERLAAVPFATCCVDCQSKRNHLTRRWGEGAMIPPYDHEWTIPAEMEEPSERIYRPAQPEEELPIHYERPLGPEAEGGETLAPRRRRGRPRKARLSLQPKLSS